MCEGVCARASHYFAPASHLEEPWPQSLSPAQCSPWLMGSPISGAIAWCSYVFNPRQARRPPPCPPTPPVARPQPVAHTSACAASALRVLAPAWGALGVRRREGALEKRGDCRQSISHIRTTLSVHSSPVRLHKFRTSLRSARSCRPWVPCHAQPSARVNSTRGWSHVYSSGVTCGLCPRAMAPLICTHASSDSPPSRTCSTTLWRV